MTELEESDSSDVDSIDSDRQLQEDFEAGKLKPGLNVGLVEKTFVNDVAGLQNKLDELKSNLAWIERLDITTDPAPAPAGTDIQGDEDIHNDFRREMLFYRQAQATVLTGIPKLHKLGVKTKRPEDFFAQMAKTDDHMKRVRERLLHKQQCIEKSEKAKKLRELRKYGKKVQREVLQKRQKEKKEMMEAVKKYRKGQKDKIDFLDDLDSTSNKQQQNTKGKDKKDFRPNKKREYKNKKFGFGGQKKRSKYNTKQSAGEISDFNVKVHQKKPGQKTKQIRPGKSKRQKQKSVRRKR